MPQNSKYYNMQYCKIQHNISIKINIELTILNKIDLIQLLFVIGWISNHIAQVIFFLTYVLFIDLFNKNSNF